MLIATWDNITGITSSAATATLTPSGYTTATTVQAGFDNLGSSAGTSKVGFIQAGAGAVSRAAQAKLRESVSVQDFGAVGDGVTDDYVAFQNAVNNSSVIIPSGVFVVNTGFTMANPIAFQGNGATTTIKAGSLFPAMPLITLSPTSGVDPKGWLIENLKTVNSGLAQHVFYIDLNAAGKYVSKLTIRNVISDSVSGKFLALTNSIPNADGLFTCVFEDNWSLNGYYLDNVGDSLIFQRNTVSGVGVGYYVNQLNTASFIIIKDCNITSAGGALYSVQSLNLRFENNQVECVSAFTGSVNAAVGLTGLTATATHQNPLIANNSINTQTNATLRCVYLNYTNGATIEGNTLFCNPSTGAHIYVDTVANNTYIGPNIYYSSISGVEITPIITDNGVGTGGVWKTPTLASWADIDPVNEPERGYFKSRDGTVLLRGRLNGAASTVGQTLFTLGVGFRPTKVIILYTFNGTTNITLQILPTGEVQMLTAGAFSISLNNISFSTR